MARVLSNCSCETCRIGDAVEESSVVKLLLETCRIGLAAGQPSVMILQQFRYLSGKRLAEPMLQHVEQTLQHLSWRSGVVLGVVLCKMSNAGCKSSNRVANMHIAETSCLMLQAPKATSVCL